MTEKVFKEKEQQAEQKFKELTEEQLDQVSGAGNPFENVDRVPLAPIDEELREKA